MSAVRSRRPLPRAETAPWGKGAVLVTATRRVFPLANVRLVFRGGATGDPPGKEGLSALTARMLERGTRKRTRENIADELETMGGSLGVGGTMETIRLDGAVLSRNLDAFFAVVADMVLEPAFAEDELEEARDEMLAELALAREDDRDLGDSFLRRSVYGENPFGRFPDGTESSLPAITREDVAARWREVLVSANLIAGGAGDVDAEKMRALLDRHLGALRPGATAPLPSTASRPLKGLEGLLIDKPERTQTQIFIGHPAVPTSHPDHMPFLLANHAFGGMFTARLMQEVRVKRGWSYGAHSRLELNRGDGLTGVWTFPANADTIPCVRLLVDLLKELKGQGVAAEELEAARGHLLNTLAFELETPEQLVGRRIQEILLGLPEDWTERWVAAVEAVTLAEANAAAARVVRPDAAAMTIVCSADAFLEGNALVEAIPEITSLDVVSFDAENPSKWRRAFAR